MGVRFGSKAASPTAVTRDATQLGGTAAAEFEALAIDLSGIVFWSGLLERYLGRARAELAEDAATAAWEEGRRTRFEHAIALALDARGPGAERAL